MKPMMFDGEVHALERALLSLSGRPLKILEWGSGGSTVHFTQFLQQHGIPYEWTSIEYNKEWHEKVSAEVQNDPNTTVVLFDVGNTDILQPEDSMEDYITYPASLGKRFDFILVDGRKRRRCLLQAKELVASHGFVFLHDAQRDYYHSAFDAYPRGRFVTARLWMGLTTQPSPLTWFFDVPRTAYEQWSAQFIANLWKFYATLRLRKLVRTFFR